jgi:hypothetical protein
MGTSKGYMMPTGGEWRPLKNEANNFIKDKGGKDKNNNPLPVTPERLLGRFITALGGARYMATGRGGSGSSGGKSGGGGAKGGRSGRAAGAAGGRLGGFLSGVQTSGLTETLNEIGLADLVGKSATEVVNGLLDAFVGPASSLDEEAARTALRELYEEILENAVTYEEVDAALTKTINEEGVTNTLADFFGKYTYKQFCSSFYEDWQKKIGIEQARQKLSEVKDYISSAVKSKFAGEKTTKKDWAGRDGAKLSQKIMQNTLFIFEVIS